MKKFTNLLLPAIICLTLFSFKGGDEVTYDKKTGMVSGPGGNVFKMESTKSATMYGMTDYSVQNMAGKELIYIKCADFNDPAEVSGASPEGRTIYMIYTFKGYAEKPETNFYMRAQKVAEVIYSAKVIEGDSLNGEMVARFISLNGTRFSDRRKELNNEKNTIIINNNTNPVPQPGININIQPK